MEFLLLYFNEKIKTKNVNIDSEAKNNINSSSKIVNKSKKFIPINKGNYSMDTEERNLAFEKMEAQLGQMDIKTHRKN